MTTTPIDRLGEAFYGAMLDAWQIDGPAIVDRVRREHPAAYLKLVASILPKSLAIEAEPLEVCTDQALEALQAFLVEMQDRESIGK